jgi:hypothetical protein
LALAADLDSFAIYQPASSSVGMYQMTDAAFAEARHYCIRDHIVVEDGCSLTGLNSRLPPGRAIELTAVFLDRAVTAIAKDVGQRAAEAGACRNNPSCGASSAKAFARRGFHPIAGERCGATYLSTTDTQKTNPHWRATQKQGDGDVFPGHCAEASLKQG